MEPGSTRMDSMSGQLSDPFSLCLQNHATSILTAEIQKCDNLGYKPTRKSKKDRPAATSHKKSKPSKRKAAKSEHRVRDTRKQLKLEGKEYVSRTGKIRPAKSVRPVDCFKCRFKCSRIPEQKRQEIFDVFYSLKTYDRQKDFVCSSVEERETRTYNRKGAEPFVKQRHVCRVFSLTINGRKERVCKKFFLATLALGEGYVDHALKNSKHGAFTGEDKRGKRPPVKTLVPGEKMGQQALANPAAACGFPGNAQPVGQPGHTAANAQPASHVAASMQPMMQPLPQPQSIQQQPVVMSGGMTVSGEFTDAFSVYVRNHITEVLHAEMNRNDNAVNCAQDGGRQEAPAAAPVKKAQQGRRSANPGCWKKNVKKQLRLEGKPYVARSGKVMPAKAVRPVDCTKCRFNCSRISEMKRQEVFDTFYSLKTYTRQKDFVCRSVQERETNPFSHRHDQPVIKQRNVCRTFLLYIDGKKERVCKKFFLATLALGESYVDHALKNSAYGMFRGDDGRGKHRPHNKTPDVYWERAQQHIMSFRTAGSEAGGKGKHAQQTPIRRMFELHKQQCEAEGIGHVSEKTYRKIFLGSPKLPRLQSSPLLERGNTNMSTAPLSHFVADPSASFV